MGGAVAAIEAGFYQDEIHEAAYRIQRGIETDERIVVGVNRFVDATREARRAPADLRGGDGPADGTVSASCGPRAISVPWTRRSPTWRRRLAARATSCLRCARRCDSRATLGEVSDALRRVFGEYRARH